MNFRRRKSVDKLVKFIVPAGRHIQPLSLAAPEEELRISCGKCSQWNGFPIYLCSLFWSAAKQIFIEFSSNKRQVVSQSVQWKNRAISRENLLPQCRTGKLINSGTRVRQAGNYAIRCLISFFPCLVWFLLVKRAVQINKQFPTTTWTSIKCNEATTFHRRRRKCEGKDIGAALEKLSKVLLN